MVMTGLILLAIGVAAILDVAIWPVVLLALGGAFILSAAGMGRQRPWWYWCTSWCQPYREHGGQHDPDRGGPEPG